MPFLIEEKLKSDSEEFSDQSAEAVLARSSNDENETILRMIYIHINLLRIMNFKRLYQIVYAVLFLAECLV